jgi:hypothetical protein
MSYFPGRIRHADKIVGIMVFADISVGAHGRAESVAPDPATLEPKTGWTAVDVARPPLDRACGLPAGCPRRATRSAPPWRGSPWSFRRADRIVVASTLHRHSCRHDRRKVLPRSRGGAQHVAGRGTPREPSCGWAESSAAPIFESPWRGVTGPLLTAVGLTRGGRKRPGMG